MSSSYLEFLYAVKSESSRALPMIERSALEAAGRRLKRLRGDTGNLQREISLRWRQQRRDMDAGRVPLVTRQVFEEQRGFPVLRGRIAEQVATAQHAYNEIIQRLGGDVALAGDALSRYHAAENGVALPERPEDDLPGLGDSWPIFRNQGLERDLAAFKSEIRRLSITLAAGRPESETFAASWDGCTGVSLPFWSISGGIADSYDDERTSGEAVSVNVAFENMTSFGVWRGQWYQRALLDAYGAATPGAWGRDGYLNVVPTTFLLARGVTVTAAMPTEVKTYAQQTFDAGGAIRVGPFTFGGGGGSATIRSTCETTSAGLKIVDTSSRALIVGIAALCPSPRNDA